MTEREKMLAGEWYSAQDEELKKLRRKARLAMQALNASRDNAPERLALVQALLPKAGEGLWIEPPFYCDYGEHILLGDNVFFNFNCVVLDVALVTIGNNVMLGPNVQLYTATHSLDAQHRRSGLEAGRPITIGDDCWIGGGAIINPGITIGARSVIGAGSVVTKDIPADVFAAGNPCQVIRHLPMPT